MLLLEIAAQGVRGVDGAGLRLRAGYNVLAVDGAALRRLVLALLRPDAPAPEGWPAGGTAARAARAGLTLLGDDGVTYRVLRDFGAGWQLQRLDPERRAFAPVTDEPAAVAEHLHGRAGVPAPGRLALLFLAADELPSRRAEVTGPVAAPPPDVPRRAAAPSAPDVRAALERELAAARATERTRERLDELQGRLFRVEELLQEQRRLGERATAAEAALADLGPVAEVVTAEVPALLEDHRRACARRDEALAEVEAERAALAEAAAGGHPRPFWRSIGFWAGAALGVGALAAGLAGHATGVRYLALLDIPAFGWAAWVALGWVGAVERQGRLERRRALADEHERRVVEAYQREAGPLQPLMAALGAASDREVEAALVRVEAAREAARSAREALLAHQQRPEVRAAEQERERVEMELRQAEALASAGGRDPAEDPGAEPGEPPRQAAPPPAPRPGAAVERVTIPAAGGAPRPGATAPEAAFAGLLAQARRELPWSVPVAAAVERQASLALSALSAGRLPALALEPTAVSVRTAAGRLPPAALSAPDRDLAWLALRLALIERLLAAAPAFALVDDALGAVPDGARRTAARLLKGLARPGQLLHATSELAYREAADHVV